MTSSNMRQVALFAFGTAVFGIAGIGLSACVNPEVDCSDEPTAPGCARDAGATDAGPRLDGGEADAGPDDAGPSDGGLDAAASDAGPCEGGCDGGYCVDGACVTCTAATAATDCEDPTPHCSDEGACVGCRSDGDCDGTTPICDAETQACRRCGENAECAGRTETPTCDEESGECVECTYDDETRCGTEIVCDVLARTCTTDTERESAGACDACVSDRQCEPGLLCVPQYFTGSFVGHFCAWRRDAGDDGLCSRVPPYGLLQTPALASLGRVTTDVCVLRNSTCEAHDHFSRQGCMTDETLTDPVPDTTCGATDHDDGYCAPRDANPNQCTVGCTTFADCPCSAPFCASQYDCEDNFCSFSRTCVVTTGSCA